MSRFVDNALAEIVFHPVDLGYGPPPVACGIARSATPDHGCRILERIEAASRAFGSAVEIEIDRGSGTGRILSAA